MWGGNIGDILYNFQQHSIMQRNSPATALQEKPEPTSPPASTMIQAIQSRSDAPFLWILASWCALLLYANPRLLALIPAGPTFISKAAVIVFVACLDSFWLFAVYHTVMVGASWWERRFRPEPAAPARRSSPRVAVLYPTRNDFREACAQSCLELEYPAHHLFLLDDSTDAGCSARIDRWAQRHPGRVSVFRRGAGGGFKAGNLNAALERIRHAYPYFAVCDADGRLPADFITALLGHFEGDPRLAFVQTAQAAREDQPDPFGRAMGFMTGAHYRHYVRARSRHGFLMFYGHGALLRTAAWEAVGGFPEVATEDLAYSLTLRRQGWHGRYTDRVVCAEDFPPTFERFRTRAEKWIRGTSEVLRRHGGPFLRSPRLPWTEKLDVLINVFSHYQTTVLLAFLLALGTLLPAAFSHFRFPGSFFLPPVPEGKSAWEYLIHIRYHIFWSVDFYLIMLWTVLAPMLPAFIDLSRKPGRLGRYLAMSHFAYLGSIVADTIALGAFLATGRAVFRNTLDTAARPAGYHPNHPAVWVADVLVGAALAAAGWQTKNLWFMAPAAALAIGACLNQSGWDRRTMRGLTLIPLLITLAVLAFVTLELIVSGSFSASNAV